MRRTHLYLDLYKKWIILAIPVTLLAAGCAGPSVSKSLERARSEYAKVQADPKIAANAQVAAYEAGQALQAAEQAGDMEKQEHLAYLAEKKSGIAIAIAEKGMAEKEIQQLAKDKNEIILKSREIEIEKTKEKAKTSKMQLESEIAKTKEEAMTSKTQLESEIAKTKEEALTSKSQLELARQQAEQAEAKSKQMEAELAELKGKQTERGIVLTLGDVLFDTGKANLMPGASQVIDRLANFLEKHSDRNVVIEGHTDSVGGEEYNIQLSQRRADSVRKALLEKGISADRIATKGYGKRFPAASNQTAAGRQYNRRVEVVVLNPGVSADSVTR